MLQPEALSGTSMSEEIFASKVELFASGLTPGVHKLRPGFWQDGRNINFEEFGVVTQRGRGTPSINSLLFDAASGSFDAAAGSFDAGGGSQADLVTGLSTPITGIHVMKTNDGQQQVFYGTLANLYLYEGATPTNVGSGYAGYADQAAGYDATRWSLANWGDWVLATNNFDKPQIFKGTSFADMMDSSVPTRAKIVFQFGPHMHFANVHDGRNRIVYSAEGDPEVMLGDVFLRGLETDIIAAVPLGQAYGIYTANELQIYSYIGNIFAFGALPSISGVGALSKDSVVPVGAQNFGLMLSGIFVTDGVQKKFVSKPALGEWLQRNLNLDQLSKITAFHDVKHSQVKWSVPTGTSKWNDLTICFNYTTGAITLHDLAFSACFEEGVFNYPIVGLVGGEMLQDDFQYSDQGNAITRYVQTKPLDLGARNNWKHVSHVQTECVIHSGAGPKLEVGTQESIDDAITWHGPFDIENTLELTPLGESGVFFTFKWSSTAADDHWELTGFHLFGALEGAVV